MDQHTGAQSVYLGAEPSLLALKRGWHIQGEFPQHDGDCLVGATVARSLNLQPGQTFALPALSGQSARVCGILAPTQGADDTFLFLTLADAQRRFKRPGQLTHALVRLTDPNQMDTAVAALRSCDAGLDMNVVPLTHLFRSIQDLVNTTRALLGAVLLVALLVAGAGVSNTVLMAVTERTREIGVLRAVGASPADIFRMIWLETVQVCLAGGVAGVLIAALSAPRVETWLRDRLPFAPSGALVHTEPGVVLACLGGALVLGSVAGLLPAWRAARLSPIEAIRTGQAV
jgi:putative ABC transport system permease protein